MGFGLATSQKRQAMLEAMLATVGKSGYEQTSVRAVLSHTGIYRQAFYDNFADKQACFLEAYDLGIEHLEGLVLAAAAGRKSWLGRLRTGLAAFLDFLDAEPDVGRALIVEVHAAGPEALAKRGEALERVTTFLDQGRLAGDNSADAPPIATEGVIAGIQAVVHARLASGANDGFREFLPDFMYFAVLPYFGPQVASEQMALADQSG
jgi:AcrR family transcriptional regulator